MCMVNRCLYMFLLPLEPGSADVPVEVCRISADTADVHCRWNITWTPSQRAQHVCMSVVTTTGRLHIYALLL